MKHKRAAMTTIIRCSKNGVLMYRLLEGLRALLHLGRKAGHHGRVWPEAELKLTEQWLVDRNSLIFTQGRRFTVSDVFVDRLDEISTDTAHTWLCKFLTELTDTAPVVHVDKADEKEGVSDRHSELRI